MSVVRRESLRGSRSERDVVADAVVAVHHVLVARGTMPNTGDTLKVLADAAAVPMEAVRAAWYRREQGRYDPPRSLSTVEQETEAVLARRAQLRADARAAEPPAVKLRRCPRCERERPPDEFLQRPNAAGERRHFGWCDGCRKRYHKDRYLRVGVRAIVVDVQEGDWCVGQPCPRCGKKFHVGDRIQGDDLHHQTCR